MPIVLVPLAQGCEELEAVTVIDLLRRAGITVITAALDKQPIKASRGVMLIADTTLDAVMDRDFDMIVLPGGQPGTDNLNADPRIHTLLKKMFNSGQYIAAICAAPKVLADAGLLAARKATCYPGALQTDEGIELLEQAVVQDDKIITSRGPGTAMDFALTLINLLTNCQTRNRVEQELMRTN